MQDSPTCQPPLISFVVPVFDVPACWLEACIRSIQALPVAPSMREIVVVDDGSRIPVAPQLSAFGEDVRCVRTPNRGLSQARNEGLSLARGLYIQFVDADDCLLPLPYACCLQTLQAVRPDIVCFRLTRSLPQEAAPVSLPPLPATLPTGTDYMVRHNLRASACGYLFRRDILGDLRFPARLLHEDEYFTPRLFLQARTVCALPVAAYYYRPHPHSITSEVSAPHVARRLDSKQHILEALSQLAGTLSAPAREALGRRTAQLTMDVMVDMLQLPLTAADFRLRVERMRRHGLYPLPLRRYTFPYLLFACLTRWKITANMLFWASKTGIIRRKCTKIVKMCT